MKIGKHFFTLYTNYFLYRPVFENNDGSLKQEGDTIRLPQLAHTYRRIATGGVDEFYRGDLAHDILQDIQDVGGIVSAQDLQIFQ